MDVHLRDLRYFTAVAEELHFRKAAERLFVSQPVLSRQIARLEQDLKAQLFIRDRRSVQLTSAGEALLHRARHLLEDWDAATKEVAILARKEQSVLVIGLQTGVGRGMLHTLTQALNAIQWRPELHQVAWNDATAGVEAGDCDAGFAWLGTTINPHCGYVVVAEEPIMLAVNSQHRLAGRRQASFAEVSNEPLVVLPESAKELRSFWLAEHARHGSPAPIACEAATADEALENVAAGTGSVFISAGNSVLYAREGVHFLEVPDLPPARLAFLWRAGDTRDVIRVAASALQQRGDA
ncbi:LysR family transcriptional regulator [Corynebacterium durum]|jgi:lysR substrate binding domain protein|uniref:LysR family transcriptional regulator n=1 Tax=Corynebacterium durum TaxID=61592 RepID=UPI0015C77ECA|nr:LysR family transcriptional regulator [Corynebacterium durum]NYI74255.1 DNA-binding transcriptional LysR family regulator [Corynebacterium durum]WJY85975.1 HTH-type transcriptional regulator BenM [Corynebacterium durum]